MRIYFCKYCGYSKKKENDDNLCPRCFHFMAEEEWEMDVLINKDGV